MTKTAAQTPPVPRADPERILSLDERGLALLRALVEGQGAILAALQAVVVEVRGLREDQRPRRPPTLTRADREQLTRILPAVAAYQGSVPFVARDLFEHESAAVQLVISDFTAKKLGRLLLRAEGQAIAGFVVRRCGTEINVALWQVLAC